MGIEWLPRDDGLKNHALSGPEHWRTEAFQGSAAFNTKKITGQDQIDFIKYRQWIAEGALVEESVFEPVLGQLKK